MWVPNEVVCAHKDAIDFADRLFVCLWGRGSGGSFEWQWSGASVPVECLKGLGSPPSNCKKVTQIDQTSNPNRMGKGSRLRGKRKGSFRMVQVRASIPKGGGWVLHTTQEEEEEVVVVVEFI